MGKRISFLGLRGSSETMHASGPCAASVEVGEVASEESVAGTGRWRCAGASGGEGEEEAAAAAGEELEFNSVGVEWSEAGGTLRMVSMVSMDSSLTSPSSECSWVVLLSTTASSVARPG